jgi:signal transduction histidine kinase
MARRPPLPRGSLGPIWVDPSQVPLLVTLAVIVSVSTFIIWSVEQQMSVMSTWDRFGSPMVSAVLLINAIVLALRPSWITLATLSTMVASSIFLQGLLVQTLYFPLSNQTYSLMSLGQYNPVYYLAAFAMFKHGARLVCWTHYGVMMLVLAASIAWPAHGAEATDLLEAKLMLALIQPSYIVALGFLVRLRDEVTAKERAAYRDKEELLAMMSHEIRGPLQTMLTSVDLLSNKVTDPTSLRAVARLGTVTQQLDRHLRDLREFTRLDNPELAIEQRPYSLIELIDSLIEEHHEIGAAKGLTLRGPAWPDASEDAQARWRHANGDPERIRQVLNNLISNALKYTLRGTVSVTVTTPMEKPNWVQIDVRDTGVGIPTDQLQHIFEPFVRLKPPGLAGVEGSGLGLAIAARLIKRLHGGIQAHSTLGHGSCFSIAFPLGH